MKKALCILGLISALAASSASQATLFNYSYTFESGNTVSGSFDGTANGNLITNLSNIFVSLDNVALNGSGNLFGSHYDYNYGFVSGGAVASFDGTQNNFLFIDADFPNSYNYTNYFYQIGQSGTNLTDQSYAYNASNGNYAYDYPANYGYTGHNYSSSRWSINGQSQATAQVPEPAPLALMAIGLLGTIVVRRKMKA